MLARRLSSIAIRPTDWISDVTASVRTFAVWMLASRRWAGSIVTDKVSRFAPVLAAGTSSMPQMGQRPRVG